MSNGISAWRIKGTGRANRDYAKAKSVLRNYTLQSNLALVCLLCLLLLSFQSLFEHGSSLKFLPKLPMCLAGQHKFSTTH